MVQQVAVDIEEMARRTQRKVQTVINEFGQDLAEEALRNTPVDTGFLRASWYVSLDSPDGSSPNPDAEKSPGASIPPVTVARLSLTIHEAKPGQTLYFLNQANYAQHVEYGTSRMAPRGFVRQTINNAPAIAERTIRRIAKT